MKINTYGRTMIGLKKAAARTHGIAGSELYLQISYDLSDGEVLTNLHIKGDWSHYDSSDIIHVSNTSLPMTQQQIADEINASASSFEELRKQYAE